MMDGKRHCDAQEAASVLQNLLCAEVAASELHNLLSTTSRTNGFYNIGWMTGRREPTIFTYTQNALHKRN